MRPNHVPLWAQIIVVSFATHVGRVCAKGMFHFLTTYINILYIYYTQHVYIIYIILYSGCTSRCHEINA